MQSIAEPAGRNGEAPILPASSPVSAVASVRGPSGVTGVATHSFDSLYIRQPRAWLAAILVAYVVAALSYAVNTPAWQAPDEPAHYNYIAHIAATGSLPVLQMGDYDQELLNALLGSKFAPVHDVAALRYESHQPPLYYLLAAPVYWMTGGSLLALRLFSILIGACTILLLYLCLELVFPAKTLIVVGATAFAALLPMHVAMLAAVNNDGLAELLIMASMLVMLSWMRTRFYGGVRDGIGASPTAAQRRQERGQLALLGILLGLGMLTKVYAYALAPILLLTIVIVMWLDPRAQEYGRVERVGPSWRTFWSGIRLSLWAAVPALSLGSLWWIRNRTVYGGLDLLGLVQHGRVVANQPRTADWIMVNGWIAYGERAFSFTFQSFWGVFGWMGVFMDQRIYTAFLLFTGVLFLGVLWAVVRLISGRPDADMDQFQLWVLGLFGVMILAVGVAYLWYNVEFVQHQGRYFFWGLLPISTIVALGWREVMQPLQGLITAVLTLVVAAGVMLVGYVTGAPNKWTVLMTGCIAAVLLLQPLLLAGSSESMMKRLPDTLQEWLLRPGAVKMTRWARAGMWSLPFVLLFVLNLAVPHLFIVPQLAK